MKCVGAQTTGVLNEAHGRVQVFVWGLAGGREGREIRWKPPKGNTKLQRKTPIPRPLEGVYGSGKEGGEGRRR